MIIIKEIPIERINEFWEIHINYLVDDGIISDEEDNPLLEIHGVCRKWQR